jgi:hypothetical protein
MQEGEDLPLSLASRWQLEGLRMRASDCTDKPKNLLLTPRSTSEAFGFGCSSLSFEGAVKAADHGGPALAAPGTSFGSKSLDGLGLAMRLCDLILRYKVAWLIPNNSSVFSNSEQE